MDTRLRLLLREFAQTGDADVAMAFAAGSLRSAATKGAVEIWVVHRFSDEEQDEISLYANKRDAARAAAREAERVVSELSEEEGDDLEDGWITRFREAMRRNRYDVARTLYNDYYGSPYDLYVIVYRRELL